jgi:predicted polyphosphate/ATP-dependent NAD kinase
MSSVFEKTVVRHYHTQVTYLMEHGNTIWYITESIDVNGNANVVDINSHQNKWLKSTDSLYREIETAFRMNRR